MHDVQNACGLLLQKVAQEGRPNIQAGQLGGRKPSKHQPASALHAVIGAISRCQRAAGQRAGAQIQPDLVVRHAPIGKKILSHHGQGAHGDARAPVRPQLFLQLARQGIARALPRLDRAAGQSPEAVAVQLVQQHPSAVGDEGCCAVAHTPGWSGWRQAWVRHGKSAWGEGQQRGDPIHLRPLVHSRRRSA